MTSRMSTKREKIVPIVLNEKQENSFKQIRSSLTCPHCKEILEKPYHLHCKHLLCQKCCNELLKSQSQCPVCSKSFTKSDIHPDPLYTNLASRFQEMDRIATTPTDSPVQNNDITNDSSDLPHKLSVYDIRWELKTQSPLTSPLKQQKESLPHLEENAASNKGLEIVSDSSTELIPTKLPKSKVEKRTSVSERRMSRRRSRLSKVSDKPEGDSFHLSDFMLVASSLSSSGMDRIRAFCSRYHTLWLPEFPFQSNNADASCRRSNRLSVADGCDRRWDRDQRYILVIRSTDGWCKRTVKYLYGLACGAWIVTEKWIQDNLQAETLIPPFDYEVCGDSKTYVMNAPRTARLAHERGLQGIFQNVFFLLRVQDTGEGIPLNILIDLMHRCGCIQNMEDMGRKKVDVRVIEVVDNNSLLTGTDVVTVDWVLNCIGSWKLL